MAADLKAAVVGKSVKIVGRVMKRSAVAQVLSAS